MQEVRLEIPRIARAHVRHAIDYYRKIAYHRGQILEGVRLCAMRNRGFWHGIQAELEQEKGRPVEREEIVDRIRAIQKREGEAAFEKVRLAYNSTRLASGLDEHEDGGPFGLVHDLKQGMEEMLVKPILWYGWEIYLCLLYVGIEAYIAHAEKIPDLRDKMIDGLLLENQETLSALKTYRDKLLHPKAAIDEGQAIDRFFAVVENSGQSELEVVFTLQRMIDGHIRGVGLGITRSIDANLAQIIEIGKSGKWPGKRSAKKFENWIGQIAYVPPNTNLMTADEFRGNRKKGWAPNLSMTAAVALVSRMIEHGKPERGSSFKIPDLPRDRDYVPMLMRAFILASEGMGTTDTAKLLMSEDPRTLSLKESVKLTMDGAVPETDQEVQNLFALDRVALAIAHEPLRVYNNIIRDRKVRVPKWMAESIPSGEAYRRLANFRNIVFHVKLENRSPDRIETEWIQYLERYPLFDIIHGLLTFFGSGGVFEKVRPRLRDRREV